MSAPTIDGYTIHRLAGRGGMGVVYEATRDDDGERVALKIVAPDLADPIDFSRRFEREAEIASQLDHPHIVPIIDSGIGDASGTAYLAMRYVDGQDLEQRVRQAGPLSRECAITVFECIADALDYAHANGFVHRDVKPANVLLADDGGVFLTDFGLTRRIAGTRMTGSGAWLGTVGYAAPEQIQGQPVDARADVYAFGALLFYALTGTPPFKRDTDMATLWAHVHDPRPALPSDAIKERAEARGPVEAVIQRAMAVDPDDRYLSAGDLAAAARAALEGQTIKVAERSVATGDAAIAPTRRRAAPPVEVGAHRGRRLGAALVALLVLTGVGIAAVLSAGVLADRSDSPPPSAPAEPRTTVAMEAPNAADRSAGAAAEAAGSDETKPKAEKKREKPKLQPGQSPSRSDDLVLALDVDTNTPTSIGPFNPHDDPTLGAATQAFGTRYTVTSSDRNSCELRWTISVSPCFLPTSASPTRARPTPGSRRWRPSTRPLTGGEP